MKLDTKFLFGRFPDLIIEWNYSKNEKCNMEIITYGSKKKYWWNCPKCKSEYESSAESRSSGRGCPYCAGKKVNHTNSLASLRPDIAELWHPTRNIKKPHEVTVKSNKKYWWICKECGSDYDMTVIHKSNGIGCPYCSGRRTVKEKSLAVLRPDILKDWNHEKNILNPYETSPNSHKKAHWKCENGHEWKAVIKSRNIIESGCPYCANRKILSGFNDIWTTNPYLASLLANPDDGYKYMQWSGKELDWKCPTCNTVIKNKKIKDINSDGLSCPKCSDGISYPEKVMYNTLLQLYVDVKTQKVFSWANNKRYDFYIPSLDMIIETHGMQHYFYNGFSTVGGRTLQEEQENDLLKESLALENNIKDYIVIDCRYSKFEYIKNNILNSKLTEYFNLENIDWESVELESSKSLKVEAIKMWNNGIVDLSYIANKLNVNEITVKKYIS